MFEPKQITILKMQKVIENISQSGLKFLKASNPEELYKIIVHEGIKLIKADYGSMLLEVNGALKRVYSSSPILYKIQPRKKGFMYRVFKNREPVILDFKQVAKIHPEIKLLRVGSDMIIPLSSHNITIGVLALISKHKDFFTKKDANTLRLFGQMATLAIKNIQLYDETKRALEARDLFISMAAHELRTPLTTINGYTQLLNTKLSDSNTSQSRWTKELLTETTRLTSLINELLEANRIKTGELNYVFGTNSIREIIKRVTSNIHFAYPNHKIVFNDYLNHTDTVVCDLDKLIQVLSNLLGNAAKFSSEEKIINLTLAYKTSYFVIIIKDGGIGIPKKDLKNIFEKFYRGTNHSKEGIGFGLFLARNIIEQHRGIITINSKVGIGTTVEVKLPKIKHG